MYEQARGAARWRGAATWSGTAKLNGTASRTGTATWRGRVRWTTARCRNTALLALAGAAALTIGACGDGVPAPAAAAERDSAGVRIVENAGPDALPEWGVGGAIVQIGTVAGEGPASLHRVTGAVRLADGGVAIANAGSGEIRVFDATGTYRVTHGRSGAGPGEFRTLTALAPVRGDTLVAYDGTLRRVTVVNPAAGIVRAFPLGTGFSGMPAVFPDGSVLASSLPPGGLDQGAGLIRAEVDLHVLSPEGEPHGALGRHPGVERVVRVSEASVEVFIPPFARRTQYAPQGDAVVVASQELPEYRVYGRDGTLQRIVRTGGALQPFTTALLDAAIEQRLADAPAEGRSSIRAGLEALPRPERLPAYGAVVTDRDGNVWVSDYPEPGTNRSEWTIFDTSGHAIARTRLPDGARVFDIGTDFVVLMVRDDLDVEHIRVLELRRARSGDG